MYKDQIHGKSGGDVWYRPLGIDFILPLNDVKMLTSAFFHVLAKALDKMVEHDVKSENLIIVDVTRDFASTVYRITAANNLQVGTKIHHHRYEIRIKTEVQGVEMGDRTPL